MDKIGDILGTVGVVVVMGWLVIAALISGVSLLLLILTRPVCGIISLVMRAFGKRWRYTPGRSVMVIGGDGEDAYVAYDQKVIDEEDRMSRSVAWEERNDELLAMVFFSFLWPLVLFAAL